MKRFQFPQTRNGEEFHFLLFRATSKNSFMRVSRSAGKLLKQHSRTQIQQCWTYLGQIFSSKMLKAFLKYISFLMDCSWNICDHGIAQNINIYLQRISQKYLHTCMTVNATFCYPALCLGTSASQPFRSDPWIYPQIGETVITKAQIGEVCCTPQVG